MKRFTAALLSAALFATASVSFGAETPAAATPPIDPNGPGFSLTIYSTADPAAFDPKEYALQSAMYPDYARQNKLPGYGVVRDTRRITLKAGENVVPFTSVAAGIDPTTVSFRSLTAPDTTSVIEQNYEYDLVSADKLLSKYLDKRVEIERQQGTAAPVRIQGTLKSFDAGNIVIQQEGGPVMVMARASVSGISLLEGGTAGLITKPTLVWKVTAEQAGVHDAQVGYQTDNITWRADYNVTVNKDDTAADIGAWVTLVNQSGASYPDAHLKLVAGDVQRVQPPQAVTRLGAGGGRGGGAAPAPQFVEKPFFEYHMYTLSRTTTIDNKATKQIQLFPTKVDVPLKKTYVYYGVPEQLRSYRLTSPMVDRTLGSQANKKVDIYLLIQNTEKNGLGIPLPAGRLRAFKRDDSDGSSEFIGEDVIQHTPKDEEVMVKLGSAFDIVGDRIQTDFTESASGHIVTESFQIKLRNHKKEAVQVLIKENLFRWSNWEITACSDKYEKQDSRTIHIPVTIEPDAEKTVTYTVRYSWD